MNALRSLRDIFLVAAVLGAALSLVFGPLMEFERLMSNQKQYYIWLAEWVATDLLLTVFLCRKEILPLVRRKPTSLPAGDAP